MLTANIVEKLNEQGTRFVYAW